MRLDDFYHLPALEQAFGRLVADRPGLVIVAGIDLPPPAAEGQGELLPSGRATIFRVLGEALLAASSAPAALVAEDAAAFRVPRLYREQVAQLRVQRQQRYTSQIRRALLQGAGLLLVDQLTRESATPAVAAAAAGARVLTQCNSPSRGVGLARELEALGVREEQLPQCVWLVAVRRLPMLCPDCRRPEPLTALQRLQLSGSPRSQLDPDAAFMVAPGCARCEGRGRSGAVALFDLCRLERGPAGRLSLEAVLPLEQYAGALAQEGALAFDDVVALDEGVARQFARQFAASRQTLDSADQTLQRRLVELQSANAVLEQRTAALISLQAVGQALISSTDLHDLAGRVCRHVRELCHADRAAFYSLDAGQDAVILAVSGWDEAYVGRRVAGEQLVTADSEPTPFAGWPPGIPQQHADVAGGVLRAGLCVPLVAEQQQVGMLIIHAMSRGQFSRAETALLQTFAHQAALLIQRTRLIDELNAFIVQLQAAQAALVERERLAHEMELAAEVQRSILPRVYPQVPGLSFSADTRPAREVGGDFYDVFVLDERTVGLVIADVSGKGMAAALYMALTRSLLLAEARRERSPRAALLNVNRLLREVGDPHMFVTVFYGTIDTASRELTYARAGHDYPLHFRGEAVEQLTGAGLVLGMLDMEVEQLTEQRVTLRDGDRLVLYTDGLTDVMNLDSRRLELPALIDVLRQQRHGSPEQICAATFAALTAYQGAAEQFDDMTIVVVGADPA